MTKMMTANEEKIYPDVIISFRNNNFVVTECSTGFSYFVSTLSLVDNLKYPSEVLGVILNGSSMNYSLYITKDAEKAIERVYEANRLLY